ncbi:flavin-containing monooxygenase [Myceligenerans indicum]|uniref:NAD(P)-binding domain-containing protein n=1 Tax=Myceligenerans indicum TaxID=2593663 RepID=A0ABS1LKS6_9MICO|nr:NAD(P)/FAD-dependent oxidoreductase [Myceligenerans indicum]MBL0886157.1 NAD(P)-binding domain-containing protein [Myceligenerans indicum]
MNTQHIETLIIGAGQAGLSTGYHLKRLGRDCLIVDGNDRIGDNWRCHYDSLALFTPGRADGLDGLPFPGDPRHFPSKDEFAEYLELYAVANDLPVRMRTRVDALTTTGDGGFRATLGDAEVRCDNVVLATGPFGRTPHVPGLAREIDPTIQQLHSSQYRRPSQLADGPTLVVGASHSGLDVAYELGRTRPTTLVGPDRGNVPLEWGTRRLQLAIPVITFAFNHVLTRRTPMGRRTMEEMRHHGASQLRVKRHHLAERGVEWITEHVTGVADGLPRLENGRTFGVASIVWATGFAQDYDWLQVPVPFEDGWPVEYRGVVESVPGLYFCGLAFQYCYASGQVNGVGRDAAFVAHEIAERSRTGALSPA